jgi:hypothetical protein
MSLSIDTRRISGIYALGQWFKVVPNSFWIDAYELRHINEHCPFGNESDNRSQPDKERDGYRHQRQPHTDWYLLGKLYERTEPASYMDMLGDTNRVVMQSPQGHDGVGFIDADTGESVYLSLIECRAFRCVSEADAIKADPRLAPTDPNPTA